MAFSFQVAYLSGGDLRFRRSLFNKICDRFWLRYVDGVASLDLAANGPHAPRNLGISHERGFFRVHVGCERSGNFALSRNKKPSCGGSIGGTSAPGGGSLISDPTDSPLSGAKAAMYTRAETFGWFPASVITAPP